MADALRVRWANMRLNCCIRRMWRGRSRKFGLENDNVVGASPCIEFPINAILPPFPIERKTTMAEA